MAFKSEIHVADLASIRTGHTEGDIYYILDNGMLDSLPCKPGTFVEWHNNAWQIRPDEHYALASAGQSEIAQAIDKLLDDGSTSETIVVAVPSSQSGEYTVGDYYEVQGKIAKLRIKTEGDNVVHLTFDTTSGLLDVMNDIPTSDGQIAVFKGVYDEYAGQPDYSGLPNTADVTAAVNAGKDVVLMLKPVQAAPYAFWRLSNVSDTAYTFIKSGVPATVSGGATIYQLLYLYNLGSGQIWNWARGTSDLGKTAVYTYYSYSRPVLSDMYSAMNTGKAVFLVLGEDMQVGGTSVAPRAYTLVKGTVMTLVYDVGRKDGSLDTLEFNCFGHFGHSAETGNSSGLVMVEAIVKETPSGDEWEWNIRFDESLSGLGNWNDSIIKEYTPYRGKMVRFNLNGRSLGLLPISAADDLEYAGLAPVNQRGQAICWGAFNNEVGYVNMPKFQSVNGPFSINGGTSLMDIDFIEIDNLSKFVALYLNNVRSDDVDSGGAHIREGRCVFTPYTFAQPWQPETSYTADSSVVWVDGQAYLCNTTHTSGWTWDATEQSKWTNKNWLQHVQDSIGAIKNGGQVAQSNGYVSVKNNSVTTIGSVNVAVLEATVVLINGLNEVPNFVLEIEPTVNCTLTIKRSSDSSILTPSVVGGNVMTGGKKYQVKCIGSCWTLAEFAVPNP